MKGVTKKLYRFAHGPTIANSSGKQTNLKGRSSTRNSLIIMNNVKYIYRYVCIDIDKKVTQIRLLQLNSLFPFHFPQKCMLAGGSLFIIRYSLPSMTLTSELLKSIDML